MTTETSSAPPQLKSDGGAGYEPQSRPATLSHHLEYAAFRVALVFFSLLPRNALRAVGGALGRLGYRLGIRRRVVEEQIAASLPELSDAERKRIAIGSYTSLGRLAVETATVSKLERGAVLDLFHPPVGWEHIAPHLAAHRGVILVTGHLGNWELGFGYLGARGINVRAVGRAMSNPLFDGFLSRTRRRLGWDIIIDREAVKRAPRLLAEGFVVPMLTDQGVKNLASIYVPFFGRLARTPRGPAVLSMRLNVPCVFAAIPLEPDGKYRMYFEPIEIPDTGNKDRDVRTMVESFTLQLERWVRKYPEQYFWQHRRWRRQPTPEEMPENEDRSTKGRRQIEEESEERK